MMAGAPKIIMSDGTSVPRRSGARCPEGIRQPLITSTRLCFSTEQANLRFTCGGSGSLRMHPEQAQRLKQRRFSSKGWTTTALDPKYLKRERGPLGPVTCGFEDGEPSLKRNEVVDLLSVAVQTLLKPENQQRLRKRLETNKQQIHQTQSKGLEQPSILEHWKSPAPTISVEDVEEEWHSEMQSDSGDSVSMIRTSVDISKTSQMTDLLEPEEGPFGSMATMESSDGSVESEGDNSLTSIRRLKVLDVHSYVHSALRASALRSWLHSRTIEGI